jgi:hypothetical protein
MSWRPEVQLQPELWQQMQVNTNLYSSVALSPPPQGNRLHYPLHRALDGHQSEASRRGKDKKISFRCRKPNPACSLVIILTEKSRLQCDSFYKHLKNMG